MLVRVLVVGDLHCNTSAVIRIIDCAADVGADLIVQVGDFGFWPRMSSPGGSSCARRRLGWIGTGCNCGGQMGTTTTYRLSGPDRSNLMGGRRRVSEHMWHLPRGHRWVWGETVWVAAGGAVSVDRYGRTEGVSWFRDEALSDADVDQIVADGEVDVLVAHDAPWGDGVLGRRLSLDLPVCDRGSWWPEDLLLESDSHMRRVRRLVEGVRASRVFHGHHHVRYDDLLGATHGSVQVSGLGDDRGPIDQAWMLVDEAGQPIS